MGTNGTPQQNREDRGSGCRNPIIIAALITAFAGIFTTILKEYSPEIRDLFQSISLPSWSSNQEINLSLQGTWDGEIYNSTSNTTFDVALYVTGNCKINSNCGSLVLDKGGGNECRVTIKITKITNNNYEFETNGVSNICKKATQEYFQRIDEDTLKLYRKGVFGTQTGILKKH